ncbi:hypothetical protein CRD60_06975 [Bifidobacterium aemilianum]|uniref:Uncharacterized protein n=1 Tax=Bifidobacterium aemilianum TaxID=2493120 RepID=A0A366K7Y7_9BIFI|nr:hypothetical protein [Bifidobacterium aemilianum]RBP97362.1 hypothetical protein CRD60_06975 [Bifidobacterium aemilianum]
MIVSLGFSYPKAYKFVKNYDPATNIGDTESYGYPGDYLNFYLVLDNEKRADTATIYNPAIRDYLDDQLVYTRACGRWPTRQAATRG